MEGSKHIILKLGLELLFNFLTLVELEDEEGRKIDFSLIKYIKLRKDFSLGKKKYGKVKYTPYKLVRVTEPSIIMIKECLEEILKRISFLDNEKKEKNIKGFRLKLHAWLRPCPSLFENLKFLTTKCNCNCVFCYNKNSPFKVDYIMSLKEVFTRIKYYDPVQKKGLFPILNEYGEYFTYPYFLDILEKVREKDLYSVIYITTNGTFLTKEVVKRLAKIKPIYIHLSLNSISIYFRKKFMKGNGHENVLKAITLLREYEIQFKGSIITWPSLPLENIEESIKFLQEMDAYYVALYLPGCTKFNTPKSFDIKEIWVTWNKVKNFFMRVRNEFEIPICLIPSAYWIDSIKAKVDGVIRNSPAHRAGIKIGDQVIKINEQDIFSRDCFWRYMTKLKEKGIKTLTITVVRNGKIMSFTLKEFEEEEFLYPYRPKGYPIEPISFYGIMMARSISIPSLRKIKEFIISYNLSKIVVFVSPLMMRQLREIDRYINLKDFFGKCEVKFFLTKNYFWGGNIILGDLMMVEDFYLLLENPSIKKFNPEAVVIPKTFLGQYGRDFGGTPYTEIERKTGIKVFLLPCPRISL